MGCCGQKDKQPENIEKNIKKNSNIFNKENVRVNLFDKTGANKPKVKIPLR